MTLWSHGFARSRCKLKPLHLDYHNAYGQQTWQDCDLTWVFLFIKSHDSLIMWSCQVIWEIKRIISTKIMAIVSKIGRLVTYLELLLPMKPHGPVITWSCMITTQMKTISHYHNTYGHHTWKGGGIEWGALTPKVTWLFNHVV